MRASLLIIFFAILGVSSLIYVLFSIEFSIESPINRLRKNWSHSIPGDLFLSRTYQHPMRELSPNDEKTLIDLENFEFTINHNPCSRNHPLVLAMVHSSPENSAKRQIIRETWANNTTEMIVLFVTGLSEKHDEDLQKENLKYQDIIQGNFIDAYKNLTYKHVMVLKWATYHCPNAEYILKTDDDVFVHRRALLDFLKHGLLPSGAKRLLLCNVNDGMPVIRDMDSRWGVAPEEYSADFYPIYCAGFVVIYSPDSAFLIYREAQKEPYFWVDDAHVTGTLAKKAGLTHSSLGHLTMNQNRMEKLQNNNNSKDIFIFGPMNVNEEKIKILHRHSLRHQLPLLLSYAGVEISKDSLP